MRDEDYEAFVKEAFIAPIRSVLIVDDDYPTLEDVLLRQVDTLAGNPVNDDKEWWRNPAQVLGVIDRFRVKDPSLLVDIHDGSNVSPGREVKVANHLHQSDLLVLDYQLDRNRKGDGTKAIEIARSVMLNDHFNLIVVHTNEVLDQVFREMLIGLMGKAEPFISEEEVDRVNELIDTVENDDETITEKLTSSIADEHYLHFRASDCNFPPKAGDDPPSYENFNSICEELKWEGADVVSRVARWALSKREEQLSTKLNEVASTALSWSSGDRKWIRSNTVFIAFTQKNPEEGADLLGELLNTLNAWQPRPSRLFLAMLRAQIEKFGVAAESSALGNNHVLAHWYSRLLKEEGEARKFLISESVSRHSEQLLDFVLPEVTKFASRLVSAEAGVAEAEDLSKKYFGIDLKDKAAAETAKNEHNAFVCSKKAEGYHLATGHVFKGDEAHWICLTPLCDLVPGRMSEARYGKIGTNLPFMAVRLQSARIPVAGDKQKKWDRWYKLVLSNRLIFLHLDGTIKAFCISDPDNEGAAPHWFTLYAKNEGVFDEGRQSFKFLKMSVDEDNNNAPLLLEHAAEVVGQLRYEYALNLMQRLGTTMTRVGLDFVGA